jgi:prepilin-type N-terminal cleavage/methylation domain-containing protein
MRSPLTSRARTGQGFTLIEILVVVVILGVLAAVTVPRLGSVVRDVAQRTAEINQAQLQRAVARYYQDHGQFPSVEHFHDQITLASNRKGQTAEVGTSGHPFGPYLLVVPTNPLTNGSRVDGGAPGTSDWFFDSGSGQVRDNHLDAADQDRVAQKMQTLMGGIRRYAQDHDGMFPTSLLSLAGAYLSQESLDEALRHPVTGENPGYVLTNGGRSLGEMGDPNQTPVLHELRNGRVWLGGVTGYADGHITAAP